MKMLSLKSVHKGSLLNHEKDSNFCNKIFATYLAETELNFIIHENFKLSLKKMVKIINRKILNTSKHA